VDALKSGQIECRVYSKDKFHAKTYITHAKLEVVGARALVGSSNFTRPGLTENVELNVQVQSGQEVAELQAWFEHHWANSAQELRRQDWQSRACITGNMGGEMCRYGLP
jgi:HKD family nuclease